MHIGFDDDGGDLLHREVPIRLEIAGWELLVSIPASDGGSSRPGLELLLHEFAPQGVIALRYAWATGASALELNEFGRRLLFRVGGGVALVHPTGHHPDVPESRQPTVRIPFSRLLDEWQRFNDRVRATLVARHPEAADWEVWDRVTQAPDARHVGDLMARRHIPHAACFDVVDAAED